MPWRGVSEVSTSRAACPQPGEALSTWSMRVPPTVAVVTLACAISFVARDFSDDVGSEEVGWTREASRRSLVVVVCRTACRGCRKQWREVARDVTDYVVMGGWCSRTYVRERGRGWEPPSLMGGGMSLGILVKFRDKGHIGTLVELQEANFL